ncbi:OTU-like cysteine protease, partial [Trifolium medium]|nr:OTU-like cysteine protease [Trifolium medium]
MAPTPNPPKEILYIDQMPLFMHPYIDDIIDVDGDGYCGYRVVVVDQNKGEDDYNLIRIVMIRELNLNRNRYKSLYGSERHLNYIRDALYPPQKTKSSYGVAPREKWLTFPDMGHIIATCYNKNGCPLPPTCLEWRNHRDEEAAAWEYSFMDRQSEFVELMDIERGPKASNKD